MSHCLKWSDSSKILSDLSQQSFNGKKGLGCRPIEPPFNPNSKYVFVADNLLCTHYGRNGHLKENCDKLKGAKERHVRFLISKNNQETKEWAPVHCTKFVRFDKNPKKGGRDLVLAIVSARTTCIL